MKQPIHHLVIHPPNWLGDVVMAQPAMRAFAIGMQPQQLTLVGRAWLKELAPWLHLGKVTTHTTMPDHADAVVLFPNSIRVAWQAWRAGIPQRIGFCGQWRRLLLTDAPRPRIDMMQEHHRDYFLDLAEQCGMVCQQPRVRLSIPDGAKAEGASLLDRHGLNPDRTIAIAPGAQFGGAKRYPVERYWKVATTLVRAGWQLVAIGTRQERDICASVIGNHTPGWNSAGSTSLAEALNLITASRLLLCNDSGTMHVAAGIGKPVVALFGATNPARTAPDGAKVHLIYHPADCSPCLQRECRTAGHPCMAAIPPDEVATACLQLLATP